MKPSFNATEPADADRAIGRGFSSAPAAAWSFVPAWLANHRERTEPDEGRALAADRTVARIEFVTIALALATAFVARLIYGWQAPFWLDEAYTGTIASQRSLSGLLNWCLHELSGPFFYGAMWLWEKIAGSSDFALRLPSLLCAIAAIVAMLCLKGPDRRTRLIWATLAATWVPSLMFASQARPQALLFLLAAMQASVFLRCMERPAFRALLAWSALGSLMALTHLHSVVITGIQFALLVGAHRRGLLPNWSAALPFVVPALWLPYQFAFLAAFLKPGVAEYSLIRGAQLTGVSSDLFGPDLATAAVCLAVATILSVQTLRRGNDDVVRYSRAEIALVMSGLAAVVVVVVVGMFKPSYHPRYLLPFMPAVLYGVAMVLVRSRLAKGYLPAIIVAIWMCSTVGALLRYGSAAEQAKLNEYEFERASAWLMARDQHRIVFGCGNTAAGFNDPALQAEMAGFFFRRAGYPATVQAVFLDRRAQNPAALAAVASKENAAIIWIDAHRRAWAMPTVPGLRCQRFGLKKGGSMACVAAVAR